MLSDPGSIHGNETAIARVTNPCNLPARQVRCVGGCGLACEAIVPALRSPSPSKFNWILPL